MEICNHHKNYSISSSKDQPRTYVYSEGAIEYTQIVFENNDTQGSVIVQYKSGEKYTWKNKYISCSYVGQFGIAVSSDGKMLFIQSWENGLFALNAKTGEQIWRTKSRRGITNIFVNDDTITVHQHNYAIQLLDIHTGEVIKEKRPATAWGFTSIDNKHIICQVTARKWEIVEAETLDTKESFTHKEFTANHTDFCIHSPYLLENGVICVSGFQNAWDNSTVPPKALPNIEFEHLIQSNYLKTSR
jgi:hypothetical protein